MGKNSNAKVAAARKKCLDAGTCERARLLECEIGCVLTIEKVHAKEEGAESLA